MRRSRRRRFLRFSEDRGARYTDTAHRVRSSCVRILRYAGQIGRPHNVKTDDLKGALTAVVKRHFAAITDPARVGELLRAIDRYVVQPTTVAALKLAPYVFVRPGELRKMEHAELNLDEAEWRIPGERMKKGELHIVPLSTQAGDILRGAQLLTGNGRYVFPSLLSRDRPISDNTLNTALRRLGYSNEEMTGHGFRTMASTLFFAVPGRVLTEMIADRQAYKVKTSLAGFAQQRLGKATSMMMSRVPAGSGVRACVQRC